MIQLRKVSKRYRSAGPSEFALRDLTVGIGDGELVAVVGTSGSGKTTLLNIAGGLDRDFTGEVEVAGNNLTKLSDRALSDFRNRAIGFVFQHFSLLDHLSALENVLLPATFVRGRSPVADARARGMELLDKMAIAHKAKERPGNLSGGQKQRVAIARALLFNPRLLLCDEPTGSLDTTTGQQIIETFQQLNAEGYTVVIITHENRVSEAVRRVIRLEDGRLVQDDAEQAVGS